MRRALASLALLALLALPAAAHAQTIDDLRACGAVPTDTVPAWLTVRVLPLDHRQHVPEIYLSVFADEMAGRIRLPSPLPLRALITFTNAGRVRYDRREGIPGGHALLGARASYDVTLRRGGAPVTAIARSSLSPALDSAMLAVIGSALAQPELAAFPAGALGDSAGLRVQIWTTDTLPPSARSLAAIKTQRVRLDRAAQPAPGTTAPYYPPQLRDKGVRGHVVLRFVVGPRGNVEPGSVEETEYTDARLVGPAVDHVLGSTWLPSKIGSCTIPSELRLQLDFPTVFSWR